MVLVINMLVYLPQGEVYVHTDKDLSVTTQ